MSAYCFDPIGRIRSCFPEKFGIPRQPNLVPEATAILEIEAAFQQSEAFRELDRFSHVWILFVFHRCHGRPWRPTVRPPRLGGNRRVGVFASRSGFRPNPIGQSVVLLNGIEIGGGHFHLHLGGVDLLDGTPVLDIKPYLPYADCISGAGGGYASEPPHTMEVGFTPHAEKRCIDLEGVRYPDLKKLISKLLAQDPRPAYTDTNAERVYGMRIWDLDVHFAVEGGGILVTGVERASG